VARLALALIGQIDGAWGPCFGILLGV